MKDVNSQGVTARTDTDQNAGKVAVIINRASGLGRETDEVAALERTLRAAGIAVQLAQIAPGDDLKAVAERAARERPAAVIAGGGDGTISAVASALAGTGVALGVLPLGTLNHFAKDLNIPLDPEGAARTIAAGNAIDVDIGEVNGRAFINNSSLGLYPSIVLDRDRQQRRLGRGKWPALFWATLTAIRRNAILDVRVGTEDMQGRWRTAFVFIGNNQYVMEGFDIGTRERLDGGRLSLYLTRRRSRGRLFMLALRALIGRLRQADDFEAITAETITIESRRRRLHVAMDGEVEDMAPPLKYRIRPGALRVLVPPAESPSKG